MRRGVREFEVEGTRLVGEGKEMESLEADYVWRR